MTTKSRVNYCDSHRATTHHLASGIQMASCFQVPLFPSICLPNSFLCQYIRSAWSRYYGGQIHRPCPRSDWFSCYRIQFYYHEKGMLFFSPESGVQELACSRRTLPIYLFADLYLLQGLNDAASSSTYGAQASDNLSYFKNPIWWLGMVTSECYTAGFLNFAS